MKKFKVSRQKTMMEKIQEFETYTDESVGELKKLFPKLQFLTPVMDSDNIEITQPVFPVARRYAILNEVEVIIVDFSDELYGEQIESLISKTNVLDQYGSENDAEF